MSATTSPQKEKAEWVKFDEVDGDPSGSSPSHQKTSGSSSGVSSARGSVNSVVAVAQKEEEADQGGVLDVSEVQVVDESALKKLEPPTFKQMQSSKKVNAQEAEMDNVNLSDEGSPQKTSDIRGRRFGN